MTVLKGSHFFLRKVQGFNITKLFTIVNEDLMNI